MWCVYVKWIDFAIEHLSRIPINDYNINLHISCAIEITLITYEYLKIKWVADSFKSDQISTPTPSLIKVCGVEQGKLEKADLAAQPNVRKTQLVGSWFAPFLATWNSVTKGTI